MLGPDSVEMCQRCNSTRVIGVSAKCSDMCSVVTQTGAESLGYVPTGLAIGGGDYVEFSVCLYCGQIQGQFPLPHHKLEKKP